MTLPFNMERILQPAAQPAHLHAIQFKRFLILIAPISLIFAILAGCAYAIYSHLGWGLIGVVLGVYALLQVYACILAHFARWKQAITVVWGSMLLAMCIIVVVQPLLYPTLVIVPLLAVAVTLPYVAGRWLLRLIWISWLVAILTTGVGILAAPSPAAPVWYERLFLWGSLSAAIAAGLLLLWYISSTLNAALAQSRAAEERFSVAVRGANDGIWDWDLQQHTVYYAPRWCEMLGLRDADISNTVEAWYMRVHPADQVALEEAVRAHIAGETTQLVHEYRIRHADGGYRWMLCRGLVVHSDSGAVRLAGSQTDVTKRKEVEARLRYTSLHDPLTELPNRGLFMDRLAHLVASSTCSRQAPFAVLFLDLDRFKIINDSLGHDHGDMLLKAIAQRLSQGIYPGDTLARLGGDEFGVLLTDLLHINTAVDIAKRIQHMLQAPFKLGDRDVCVTASTGIASSTSRYTSAEEMLRDADIAMYRAKLLGPARIVVFDQQMHTHIMTRMQIEHDLRRAITHQEFVVHYQALVSLATGHICGFEALLRWYHPDRGVIGPATFLPVAEESGLIVPIGEWVLRQACDQIAAWQTRFPQAPPLWISVNLASAQLMSPGLVPCVADVLHDTRLAADQLRLEITEGVILDRDSLITTTLCDLHRLGVQIHLDDFGTGYASLISLHRLPISAVKIDRTFVSTMDAATENAAIVRAIVALSHNLKLDVIAEGVETAAHVAALRSIKCDYGQGYYWSRPVIADHAEQLVAARSDQHAQFPNSVTLNVTY